LDFFTLTWWNGMELDECKGKNTGKGMGRMQGENTGKGMDTGDFEFEWGK
jgi:hypothetical protein